MDLCGPSWDREIAARLSFVLSAADPPIFFPRLLHCVLFISGKSIQPSSIEAFFFIISPLDLKNALSFSLSSIPVLWFKFENSGELCQFHCV